VLIVPLESSTTTVTLLSFIRAVKRPVALLIDPDDSLSRMENVYGGLPLDAEKVNSSLTFSVIARDGFIVKGFATI
jgi:hypothetical protein